MLPIVLVQTPFSHCLATLSLSLSLSLCVLFPVTFYLSIGYFADLPTTTGTYEYRGYFQTADATCWNSTASGGTNTACLAANAGATSWKCLMAEYLTDYIETQMYAGVCVRLDSHIRAPC